MIDTKALMWTAGFLEGEGAFSSVNCKWGRQRWISRYISASQVQKEPLERLHSLFGGSLRQYKNGKHSPYWRWIVTGKKAIALAMTLFCLMSPERRKAIRQMIEMWKKTPPHANAAKTHCKRGHEFNETNTYVRPSGGHRECRLCTKMWFERQKQRLCKPNPLMGTF